MGEHHDPNRRAPWLLSAVLVSAAGTLGAPREAAAAGTGDSDRVSYDTDGDGRPDVWESFPKGAPAATRLPVRREVDLNHDGKVDVTTHYQAGQIVREEMDGDFDGKVDWTDIYEGGQRVRTEWDSAFDAKADMIRHFEGGELVRVEQDTNGDGRPDYFEFYKGGALEKSGRDTDGDGQVDRWDGRRPGQ